MLNLKYYLFNGEMPLHRLWRYYIRFDSSFLNYS